MDDNVLHIALVYDCMKKYLVDDMFPFCAFVAPTLTLPMFKTTSKFCHLASMTNVRDSQVKIPYFLT